MTWPGLAAKRGRTKSMYCGGCNHDLNFAP